MTEAEFSRWLRKAARKAGWLAFHFAPAVVGGRWVTNTQPGFPDWVLIRPPRVVFLEVKRSATAHRRPEQVAVIAALQACDEVEAWFASPADAGEVLALLATPRKNPLPRQPEVTS